MKIFLFLSILVLVWAQSPPCTTPQVFQASVAAVGIQDSEQQFTLGTAFVNGNLKNFRFDFYSSLDVNRAMGSMFIFYKQDIGYYVDRNTSQCTQFQPQGTFDISIPKTAIFTGYSNIGTQQVANYLVVKQGVLTSYTVTTPSCLPVAGYTLNVTNPNTQLTYTASYTDVVTMQDSESVELWCPTSTSYDPSNVLLSKK